MHRVHKLLGCLLASFFFTTPQAKSCNFAARQHLDKKSAKDVTIALHVTRKEVEEDDMGEIPEGEEVEGQLSLKDIQKMRDSFNAIS